MYIAAGVSRGSALQKEVDMRDVGLYDKVSHNQQAQQQQQHQQPHKEPDIQVRLLQWNVYLSIVDTRPLGQENVPSLIREVSLFQRLICVHKSMLLGPQKLERCPG